MPRLAVLPPLLHEPIEPPSSQWDMPTGGPIDSSGLVAIGADLEPGTLLAAYRAGLFPMPFDRRRVAWFSPDPRGILPLHGLRVSRSLRRSMRRFTVGLDTCFDDVVAACADPRRTGAWISPAIHAAYRRLHDLGWAHSIEVFDADTGELAGGLYGVRVAGLFAGESMFHRATDASKVALVHLVEWLSATDAALLDVQWRTDHLASLGVVEVPRSAYLERLAEAIG